jgi:putative flippase GtrA
MTDPRPTRSPFASVTTAIAPRLPLLRKAASFGMVGLVNTGLDFGIFWTAVQQFGWPLIPANILAWLIAVSASYAMNSFITFAAESGRKLTWRAYATFVASGILGMVANTATLVAMTGILPLAIANPDVQLAVAKLSAILVSFIVNFSMSHFVVFKTRPHADARQ